MEKKKIKAKLFKTSFDINMYLETNLLRKPIDDDREARD